MYKVFSTGWPYRSIKGGLRRGNATLDKVRGLVRPKHLALVAPQLRRRL